MALKGIPLNYYAYCTIIASTKLINHCIPLYLHYYFRSMHIRQHFSVFIDNFWQKFPKVVYEYNSMGTCNCLVEDKIVTCIFIDMSCIHVYS